MTFSMQIEQAKQTDLQSINHVITDAIMTWNLPERVKRLALASYLYNELDLKHLNIMVAKHEKEIIGVVSWETAAIKDTPNNKAALLLHGLYVTPTMQHQGVGKKLLDTAEKAVKEKGLDGLLVKAHAEATRFFIKQGMWEIKIQDPSRDYAHRLWKDI